MKDFIDHANKNEITLLDKGKCQFCGANCQKGIFECMDNFNNGLNLLNFEKSEYQTARFLSVDAHALQHPEIHGRWSNHFHLTRLYLMLDKNLKWDYKRSPLLSDYLNEYKLSRPNEFLIPPKPMERGNITVKDLAKVTTAKECFRIIKEWSDEVYKAWCPNHLLVSQIGAGFLDKRINRSI
ncbi:MAG: DUF5946 family protein [Bacteroidetes bacterium]|nr:DUF5946 family protein [Bacteroidota bacterium]